MKILIIIFSIIILFLFINLIKLKNDINKLQLSNINDLIFDNLKVKNLEIVNELKSPTILTNNINSFNENSININNDINIHKDINTDSNARLKIKFNLGNDFYIGNKINTFNMKNINSNYLIPFKNIIIKDLNYEYHVLNDELHNRNPTDYYIRYITN